MVQSMSGKGNCYDNAVTETLFKTLKTEWMYGKRYRHQQELRQTLFDYIEVFYNRKRLHSTLGYKSPGSVYAAVSTINLYGFLGCPFFCSKSSKVRKSE